MRKYTVSVSDDLGEKIDRWKSEISPSATFQAAMAKVIEEKEGFVNRLKGDETMEQIIERLRAEKNEHENVYFNQGKDDGLEWAKAASYPDLRYAAEVFEPAELEYAVKNIYRNEVLGDYFHTCLGGDPATTPGEDDDFFPDAGEQWLKGWTESVWEFWKEVARQL